jgi:uncharacterized protein YkwD
MNWIDLCVFFILLYFAYRGFAIGLIASLFNLVTAVTSIFVAFKTYNPIGDFFVQNLGASAFAGPVLGFFAMLILCEIILTLLFSLIYRAVHSFFLFLKPLYWLDKAAGIVPQLIIGFLLITAGMIAIVRLPVSTTIKTPVLESYWGKEILPQTTVYEPTLRQMLGSVPQETLLYLIPKAPKSDETIKMSFPENIPMAIDEADEQGLFVLTNKERKERGLKELVWDPTIVPVARAHSEDMFRRSYFSHISPDGKSPFDRMSSGGVQYMLAGENLAYAPTVEIAHKGLMNSPGHRENILREEFGRIGIGVIDGGIYGKMYTQNFAD